MLIELDEARRCAAFFHELDAWTEYWDIYHPETNGHFYRGNDTEPGLLTLLVLGEETPPVYTAWKRWALRQDSGDEFRQCASEDSVASAALELDDLAQRIFAVHFGDPADPVVRRSYLHAIHACATDTLPPATERASRIAPDDPRRRTAGRHTIEGDMMWFIWALEVEGPRVRPRPGPARVAETNKSRTDFHALVLAGVATGSAANFARRGHRRTRPEYGTDDATRHLLLERGLAWAGDVEAAAEEVHQLFQIREWGTVMPNCK